MDKVIGFPKFCLIKAIAIYQYVASPWVGQSCRFYPSCSQYAKTAIKQYGAIRGSYLMVLRLLKCHPFHSGGIDEVP